MERGLPLRPLDHSSYVSVAAAIAQTLGAILGLYFTAIGVVVTGVYSRVPTDVRSLAIREQVGVRYLRTIALTCIYALYLGGLDSARLLTTRSGFAVLLLLTTYSIFAFTQLGLRVYHFLDPELLADRLRRDIYLTLRQLRFKQPYAGDTSFQVYYRKKIDGALATYSSLFTLALGSEPNLEGSEDLIRSEIDVWTAYTSIKSEIPAASEWYQPQARHKSILASDDSTTFTIYLATSTMPQPKVGRDYLWFDRNVAHAIAKGLIVHLTHGDIQRPLDILNTLQYRFVHAANALAVEEAMLLERIVSSAILDNLSRVSRVKFRPAGSEAEEAGLLIQLCDFVGLAPLQILLGMAERLRKSDPRSLFDTTDWRRFFRHRRFYWDRLPRSVNEQLEEVTNQLAFEVSVEDQLVTSAWYLRQRYATAVVNQVKQHFELIAERLLDSYLNSSEQVGEVSGGLPAIHLVFRGLEACHKLVLHGRDIATWCDTMRSLHVPAADLATAPDLEALGKKISDVETGLHERLAQLAFKVYDSDAKLERTLPDYFGQAYMTIAHQTFERLRKGVIENDVLLRAFFGVSLLAVQRLGTELAEVANVIARVTYLTEPIVNLLDMSGYAFLFSQLHARGDAWRIVRGLWDDALGKYLNPEAIRVIYEDRYTAMRPWYTQRFNWQRAFHDDLAQASVENRWLSPFLKGVAEDVLSWHGMHDLNPRDAFYLVYLRRQTAFATGPLPQGVDSLLRQLNRVNDESIENERNSG